MASVDQPGLWSFATLKMPPEPGSYQTVGLLLKIAGWIRLAQLGLVVLVGLIMLPMMVLMGAAGATVISAGPWGLPGAALGGMFLLVAALVLLVIAAVYVAMTYWTSWIYAKWVGKDPRALKHLFIYAIVTVVLSGLAALGGLAGNPSGLVDVGLLVIGILLLIESRKPEIPSFEPPVPQRPEAWRPLE